MSYILEVSLIALTLSTNMTPNVAAQSEPMQRGISVELAITRNAVLMPDADDEDASVLTVTDSGSVYLGIDPIAPADVAERVKGRLSTRKQQKLYVKADARTQYASIATVLDAARAAGVEAPALLTAQPDWSKPGTIVPPRGLEVLIGQSATSGQDSIVVQVLNSGKKRPTVKINNREIHEAGLRRSLAQIFGNRNEKTVLVQADGLLPFAQVVHVIDLCHSTGASVVLVTPAL
jgi:biopolymer transport protein TolR